MKATTCAATRTWKPSRPARESASARGSDTRCKYVEKGEVSFRLCPRGGRCERCAFAQMIEDWG